MDSNEVLRLLLDVSRSGQIWVSPEQRDAMAHFETCRTAARGCRILHCPDCKTTMVLYSPCNKRGCPKCAPKNQMAWMSKARARILPTGHHHLVFSIPSNYTEQWMHDRAKMISRLFCGVDAVLKELESSSGLLLGRMLVFQSHARGMSFKPHIHCLLADGGLNENKQWKPLGPIELEKMTQSLEAWFAKQDPTEAKNEGWSVYQSFHAQSGESVVEYLGRTMAGLVLRIDEHGGINKEGQLITFEDRHEGVSRKTTLKETTFVQRYLGHIPPRHCVTVRYYGLYSNRHRAELAIARDYLDLFNDREHQQAEVYVEACPCCHKPMKQVFTSDLGQGVNYQRFGFGNGPPIHGEYRRVS